MVDRLSLKKYKRNELPPTTILGQISGLVYQGPPARTQGEFGDTGLADMVCVDQFGEANTAKYYHAGIVKSERDEFWVYLEWGRIFPGFSWENGSTSRTFQFISCMSEGEARSIYIAQCKRKNSSRIERKTIGSKDLWVSKEGKDGYLVQDLASRQRGLPHAYTIGATVTSTTTPLGNDPISKLAQDLCKSVTDYTQASITSTGVSPTLATIEEVRDSLLPLALQRLKVVGKDIKKQLEDSALKDISNVVASLVPRPIPLRMDQQSRALNTLLTSDNILRVQQDLDAFEET